MSRRRDKSLRPVNHDSLGFIASQREAESTEVKLDRVAQGGSADHFDLFSGSETHFEKPHGNAVISRNITDRCSLSELQNIKRFQAFFHQLQGIGANGDQFRSRQSETATAQRFFFLLSISAK